MRNSVAMPRRTFFDKFDVGLILLTILLYVVVAFLPFAPKKFGDGVYFREAKIIAEVLHGTESIEEITVSRAPGPVLFYAVPYSIVPTGSPDNFYWFAGFIWTIGFICLSMLLIRRSARLLGGELSGRIAVLTTFLIPFVIYYSYGVNAEPLAFTGAAAASFAWLRLISAELAGKSKIGNLILLGGGLTAVILARPNAVLILPLGLFAAFFLWRNKQPQLARTAIFAVVITAVSSLSVLQFASRLSGGGQEGNFYHVAFHGRFQYRTEPFDWRFWDDKTRTGSADFALFEKEKAILEQRSTAENIPILQLKKDWAIRDVPANPLITIRQAAVRCLTLHLFLVNSKPPAAFRVSFVPGVIIFSLVHIILNSVYIIVITGGLFYLLTNRKKAVSLWVLWGFYPALLIFHALTYAEPRYLIPALPGLIILSAAAFGKIIEKRLNFESNIKLSVAD